MPDQVGHDGEAMATLSFLIGGFDETKSLAADIVDDEVDVIDIFSWDKDNAIVGHHRIGEYGGEALDLSDAVFQDHGGLYEKRYYLIMANLDPDTADYIATLSGTEVNGYPKGYFPWSAGNCRPNRPIMGATAYISFARGFSTRLPECIPLQIAGQDSTNSPRPLSAPGTTPELSGRG